MVYGIDIGSRQVKILGMDEETQTVVRRDRMDTVQFYRNYGRTAQGQFGLDAEEITGPGQRVTVTGYGRYTLQIAHSLVIPEIQAHVLGAIYQTGLKDFLLVDLGGQDSKVIRIDRGKLQDFVMNDKCAASAGRFLENMAQVLTIPLSELGDHWEDPAPIASTCAVFSESEVVGLLIRGVPVSRIAAGINTALFSRLVPMISRFKFQTLVLAGGASQSQALIHLIQRKFDCTIYPIPDPLFNGALGCCIHQMKSPPNVK